MCTRDVKQHNWQLRAVSKRTETATRIAINANPKSTYQESLVFATAKTSPLPSSHVVDSRKTLARPAHTSSHIQSQKVYVMPLEVFRSNLLAFFSKGFCELLLKHTTGRAFCPISLLASTCSLDPLLVLAVSLLQVTVHFLPRFLRSTE